MLIDNATAGLVLQIRNMMTAVGHLPSLEMNAVYTIGLQREEKNSLALL